MKYKRLGTGFLLVAGIFLFMSIAGCIFLGKWLLPAVNIYNEKYDWSELPEGRRVNVTMDFLLDVYEREGYGISYDVYREYTVPKLVCNEEGMRNITQYMGVKVPRKDFEKYDAVVENSWAWLSDATGSVSLENGSSVKVKGVIKKMDDKDIVFIKNYLMEVGYRVNEADLMVAPYYIDTAADQKLISCFVFAGFAVTLVMAAIAVIMFKKGKKLSLAEANKEPETTSEDEITS